MVGQRVQRPVVGTVAREHADDTTWRLESRARLCAMPTTTTRALRALDHAIAAHADALAVTRDAADPADPAELPPGIIAFIDARRAIQTGDGPRFAAALDADVGDDELVEAVSAAFAWTPAPLGKRLLRALVRAEASWLLLGVGFAAHAARARNPGPSLAWALDADDPVVRAAAAECAARAGRVDLAARFHELASAARGPDRAVMEGAAALLGDRRARASLLESTTEAPAASLGAVALRLGGDPAPLRPFLDVLRANAARPHEYIEAVAAVGDPAHVEGLIDAMAHEEVARHAGLAFELVTGIEVRRDLAEPGDDADDADPLRDRPIPRRDAVAAAWRASRPAFTAGKRYLLGALPSESQCRALLASDAAPRAHREAAALELARIEPRHGWSDVDAPLAF